ncbi:MAG: hypothetical protein ACREJ0_04315, partial [Geminicoccaceae bacterium]
LRLREAPISRSALGLHTKRLDAASNAGLGAEILALRRDVLSIRRDLAALCRSIAPDCARRSS